MHTSCPRCDCDEVGTPAFTWWGGMVGAWVLHHRICRLCGFAFSAKSGASNRRAIVLYTVATNALLAALMTLAESIGR